MSLTLRIQTEGGFVLRVSKETGRCDPCISRDLGVPKQSCSSRTKGVKAFAVFLRQLACWVFPCDEMRSLSFSWVC